MWQKSLKTLRKIPQRNLYTSKKLWYTEQVACKIDATEPTPNLTPTPAKQEPIKVTPYIKETPTETIAYDEIPGPISLRLISKFWGMIPVMGTELTVSVIQHLLSGGNFFNGLLSWGGNAPFFKKFFDVYGPVVRLHGAFGSDVVLLSRPEHAAEIFMKEGAYPVRSCLKSLEKYRLECRKYRQAGPFLTYGTEWERLRKCVEEPLQNHSIEDELVKLDGVNKKFIDRLLIVRNKQEEMPNNFLTEIHKWVLECLCAVTLNRSIGFLEPGGLIPSSDPGRLLDGLFGATNAIRKLEYGFQMYKFIETPSWKSLVKNCDAIENVLYKYIDKSKESLIEKKLKNNIDKVNLIEQLLLKENVIEDDIMTIMLDLFLIGFNANAHTVSFFLYNLARNPRCQIKLYDEIKHESVTNIKNTPYLQACLKETLRLYPPIPILSRELNKDVIIHHYRIPKGTNVLFAAHLNNMRDEYFEDAAKFKPQRWLGDDLGGFGNEYQDFATMPFGYGPRSCLAKDLAGMAIGSLVAELVRNFRVEYNYGDVKSSNELIAAPTKPLKFRFINRV